MTTHLPTPPLRGWSGATGVAAALVPGLALWVPSGYSWGAVWLLLCALAWGGRRGWQALRPETGLSAQPPLPRALWALMAVCCGMGLLACIDAVQMQQASRLERVLKHLLVLPCLVLVTRHPPRLPALWWGIVIGACGSGLIALWQVHGQGLERAQGFTNAIQYGNLSLLLAVWAFIGWWCVPGRTFWRLQLARGSAVLAVLLGLLGSLLSLSRGGWVALLLAAPVLAALAWRHRSVHTRLARWWAGLLALAGIGLLTAALQTDLVQERWQSAQQEVEHYYATGDAQTSVGQRLDHWRLAWNMGWDRPLLGWGLQGYAEEKQRRVAAGEAHPFVLEFDHAHNEWLDLFAKKGLVGVMALALFLGVPLAVFWPTRQRLQGRGAQVLPLRLMGVALPLMYLGFGSTQVFFAHNSGLLFYLFMLCLLWGVLCAQARTATPSDMR